jgi:hypothetical protein
MYMANFSDWLVKAKIQELFPNLSLLTVSERESTYMRKQVRKALEAGKFLKALGYPTEREALGIVSHGNLLNVPYGTVDIKCFFDIYSAQIPGVRGKMMKQQVKRARMIEPHSKLQVTAQEMTANIMHVAGERFLVSVLKPLGLLLVKHVNSLGVEELGTALRFTSRLIERCMG